MRRVEIAAMVGVALGAAACPSNVQESMTVSADGGESSSTGAGTTSGTSDDDATASVGTDESGEPPQTTSAADGLADDDTSGTDATEGSDASDGPAESTGEPDACVGLDEDECDDAGDECMAVMGSPFVPTTGSNYCIGDPEFVGCIATAECKKGEFVRCDFGRDAWFLTISCPPEGWLPCDEPGNGHASACE